MHSKALEHECAEFIAINEHMSVKSNAARRYFHQSANPIYLLNDTFGTTLLNPLS